jgi:hypothetical protein
MMKGTDIMMSSYDRQGDEAPAGRPRGEQDHHCRSCCRVGALLFWVRGDTPENTGVYAISINIGWLTRKTWDRGLTDWSARREALRGSTDPSISILCCRATFFRQSR